MPDSVLAPGARVGSYEILAKVGEGGMGEVYRARDTKLNRDVAIKVLPEAFIVDPDRLARFKREAQVLASLNHPNIAHVHGLEESGAGVALVMELVEGEDLAQRLTRGAIPLDDALGFAKQIADALEAAHERGIVHRDLKPANIKVRDDGTVKVLDFGLAKAVEQAPGSGPQATGTPSMSPTITTPAMMTGVGMILGTAAYMSPEQARGRSVDKRADVWAFGCVLFEMLTGRRAFEGEDVTETLASVIKGHPDWSAFPSDVPRPIVMLLRGCLEKDFRKRTADVAAAQFVLTHAGELVERVEVQSAAAVPPQPAPKVSPWKRTVVPVTAALSAALLAGGIVWWRTRPTPPAVVRTTIVTSGASALVLQGADRDVLLTPDGSRVIYRGNNRLLVRALDQLEATTLYTSSNGTNELRGPVVSPDGQWVAFFEGQEMKKVAITGGPAVVITRIGTTAPRGATWGPNGDIVFATSASNGLRRVSGAGGDAVAITHPDREHGEGLHVWPEFLPGGQEVLFTIVPSGGAVENAQIAVLDLKTGKSKVLVRGGSHAYYVPTGHLVYGSAGTLRAVAFDPKRLEVTGTPAPVLDGVVTASSGAVNAFVGPGGSLVYVAGAAGTGAQQTVVSVDRQGRATPLSGIPPDSYRDVRLSPDGKRVALAIAGDVLVYDIARATTSRLTTNSAHGTRPLWTPDGSRVIFTSSRSGYPEIYWRAADGTGGDERLLSRAHNLLDLRGSSWSADGKQLVVTEAETPDHCATLQLAIDRPSEIKTLLPNEFCSDFQSVSPDGHWMAYHSTRSGRFEIYVERYPEMGNRQQISADGGLQPLWSRDGRELFFRTMDNRTIMAVAMQPSGSAFVAGRPQKLLDVTMIPPGGGTRPYDIAPDGRFFIIRPAMDEAASSQSKNMVLVQNWTEELKRLVPSK